MSEQHTPDPTPRAPEAPAVTEPVATAPPAPPRRVLRAVLRWSGAAVLCGALGTATAFAVAAPPRTDIPGLATPDDGRYTFPPLDVPALPASVIEGSSGVPHGADLRTLLLPPPRGATADRSLSGWYPVPRYVARFGGGPALSDTGCRHIAARAWTMPDGTRTEIYLLGFRSPADAQDADAGQPDPLPVAPDAEVETAPQQPPHTVDDSTEMAQPAGPGRPAVRYAQIVTGDVEALVVMSNPKAVPDTPFQQVVLVQSQLLA